MAGFSLLKAGGVINSHRDEDISFGPLIWHYGIVVPSNCCLIVNNNKKKGKHLIE